MVLTLEFMIEDDPIDPSTALRQPLRGPFIGAIDLDVMFPLALAFEAIPQGLAVTVRAVSMPFQQTAACLGQRDRVLTRTGHASGLDEPLVAEVPEVASARTQRPIPLVAEIMTGDHSKRANGCERSRFRAAQGVLAITVPHDLPLLSARQIQMTCERFPRVEAALRDRSVAVGPARIIPRIMPVVVRLSGVRPLEVTAAVRIEADDLAVEDGGHRSDAVSDLDLQHIPLTELVAVPRNETAPVAVDVRERAEAVVLHFEQPVGMVEGLRDPDQRHRSKLHQLKAATHPLRRT